MRRFLIVIFALSVSLAVTPTHRPSRAEERQPADESNTWMKKKLEFSQNILSGLTEGNHEKIATNATAMNYMNYLEKWVKADKPEYKRQLSYFELANRELLKSARDKNIEGATLAYNQLTISCVQCHKVVRDSK